MTFVFQLLNVLKIIKNVFCFFVLLLFSCFQKTNKNAFIEKIVKNDIQLLPPKSGDWLAEHEESKQTFNDFNLTEKLIPNSNKFIIYLVPIEHLNDNDSNILEKTRKYVEIFFQLKTVIAYTVKSKLTVPKKYTRVGTEKQTQILTTFLLDSLMKQINLPNKICAMAITNFDLFPHPDWNYVFGQAAYLDGTAVTSLYRFHSAYKDSSFDYSCFLRMLKVCSHEIAHMFGLSHCIYAKCAMNGSNHLTEMDQSPLRLCSNCQLKLGHSLHWDFEKRLNELINFLEEHNNFADLELLKKDK